MPIENSAWAYELSLYIHLNPIRTLAFGLDKKRRRAEAKGLAPPATPGQVNARLRELRGYRWSS